MKRLSVSLVFFISCTSSYHPPKGMGDGALATASIQSVDDRFFVELGAWPDGDWWNSFEDQILSDLIKKALETSPQIEEVTHRIEQFKAMFDETKSSLFPWISFAFEDQWQHYSKEGIFRYFLPGVFPPVLNQLDIAFNLQYEIDVFGKNRMAVSAALSEAQAQEIEKNIVELSLTTAITSTYLSYHHNLRKKELLLAEHMIRKELTMLHLRRIEAGIESQFGENRSEILFLEVEKKLDQINRALQSNVSQLRSLLGVSPDALLELDGSPHSPRCLAVPERLSCDLLARRPDLTQMVFFLEKAAHKIGAAKAAFYPSINLQALVGLESLFWSSLFQNSSYVGLLYPAIHLPIFEGGRLSANLKKEEQEFERLLAQYKSMIAKAANEAIEKLTAYRLLSEEMLSQEKSIEIENQSVALQQALLDSNLASDLSLYEERIRLIQLEIVKEELQQMRDLAYVEVIRALGGGFDARGQK